jgi:hypothetical protein
VRFNNTGQIAANRIYFYSIFKLEQPDKTTREKDIEANLLKEEPIVYERLVFPNEEIESHITMDEDALSRIQLMLHNYCSNQSSISSLLNIFSCLSACWCSLSDSIVSNVCPHS